MNRKGIFLSIGSIVAYLLMLLINSLANILPLNNVTTGMVSDSYPNLFAPAGITFSIWGLIYLLLGIYTIFQFREKNKKIKNLLSELNIYYIISSIANAFWIFSWHYHLIWLSVVLMLVILISLIKIADLIGKNKLSLRNKLFIKIPFGVYFAWITIATIANISTFLVSVSWNGFGLADSLWMIIVLIIGASISIWRMLKDNNIAYGLVPVWAYLGILFKHLSETGFNGHYPLIILVVLFCLLLLITSNFYLLLKKRII